MLSLGLHWQHAIGDSQQGSAGSQILTEGEGASAAAAALPVACPKASPIEDCLPLLPRGAAAAPAHANPSMSIPFHALVCPRSDAYMMLSGYGVPEIRECTEYQGEAVPACASE